MATKTVGTTAASLLSPKNSPTSPRTSYPHTSGIYTLPLQSGNIGDRTTPFRDLQEQQCLEKHSAVAAQPHMSHNI
ncbi:hypothetical protein K443DRAFT_682710 [Laccaria amethystina LaAM-08-1]|uniref:Uncharacterized protein n=1 Tax=Laccaria amethystina LaAM-08-1 TaxID=1095629 RepID=A0A0C9WK51_9AGAR|nr:hypothetical protein K443DRAFT_682710 [Laccaria amethystina LaAM-08-1]